LFLFTHEQVEKIICAPPDVQDWSPLFVSSEFFTSYGHYLAIDIISPNAGVRFLPRALCVAA
jgi:poly(A) polymerase Pap1